MRSFLLAAVVSVLAACGSESTCSESFEGEVIESGCFRYAAALDVSMGDVSVESELCNTCDSTEAHTLVVRSWGEGVSAKNAFSRVKQGKATIRHPLLFTHGAGGYAALNCFVDEVAANGDPHEATIAARFPQRGALSSKLEAEQLAVPGCSTEGCPPNNLFLDELLVLWPEQTSAPDVTLAEVCNLAFAGGSFDERLTDTSMVKVEIPLSSAERNAIMELPR